MSDIEEKIDSVDKNKNASSLWLPNQTRYPQAKF